MNQMKVVVEHDGVEYSAVVMRIKATSLGEEDHGIFTAFLHCEGAGTGVGIGGFSLDEWSEDDHRRIGTSFGMEHISALMKTVGVRRWEDLSGRDVLVLHDGPDMWGRSPVGIASLMGERVLIFKLHADEWRARISEVSA